MAGTTSPPAPGQVPQGAGPTRMQRLLDVVERVGNRVPHPVVIFVILLVAVVVLSQILALAGARVTSLRWNPATDEIETVTIAARGLLSIDGLRFMFTGVVSNFMGFNAVGVIIVAMVGVGVAEEAGLVKALIRKLVIVAPPRALTYILTFVGILSSIAADAGYLVLIPLAAAAFASVGRHPLAGLALAFAAVAAAFTVNILIVPVDGILTEITNDAIHLVDPARSIDLTANLWFSIASVVLLTVLIAQITERIVEPRLGQHGVGHTAADPEVLTGEERRGLRFAFWALIGVLAFLALMTLPPGAPLRHPETGAIIGNSPFMNSLIVTIALIFFATGAAYGLGAGTLKDSAAVVAAMTKAIGSLSGLILLLLVISQFLAFFNYSNMAALAAISLAEVLQRANLDALWLLIGFVVVVLLLDVIITGAIPKWALFAPIFVPLLMKLGVAPEAVLAAYRVGDSPVNAITPLNAYFALIVTFAQQYQKDAGVGTVIALMLPYVVILAVVWTALLAAWHLLGLPWGL
ncbi:AbgT family transporter [Roseomonas sp. OT10]|uniref:AbgT family transporter n=1 Tax=Roseomonas cutis TaxID=2897332 RepID=UPI001E565A14|nr:AbgT family transporter [Roseomonas sp. OT10]UFN49419.1 AbgT family transporter [Roseomonas sp. OT10]